MYSARTLQKESALIFDTYLPDVPLGYATQRLPPGIYAETRLPAIWLTHSGLQTKARRSVNPWENRKNQNRVDDKQFGKDAKKKGLISWTLLPDQHLLS